MAKRIGTRTVTDYAHIISTNVTVSDDERRVIVQVYDERRGLSSLPIFEATFELPDALEESP